MVENRQLEHARELARHGNFHRAARSLGISQPALTRSIQALEDRLGVRLFDRGAKGVTPTSFGRMVVERSEAILTRVDELLREVQLMQGLEVGEVSIGCGGLIAVGPLGPALGRIVERNPKLRIRVHVQDQRGDMEDALRRGETEFFVTQHQTIEDETLESTLLGSQPGSFFCRPGHPLLAASPVALGELIAYPIALSLLPAWLLRRLPDSVGGLRAEGNVTVQCQSFPAVKAIVASSQAVSWAPLPLIARELEAGELCRVSVNDLVLDSQVGVVRLRGRTLSPVAEAVVEALREVVESEARAGSV